MILRDSKLVALLAFGALAWGGAGAGPAAAQDAQGLARLASEVAGLEGRVIIGLRPAPGRKGMPAPGVRALDRLTQAAIATDLRSLGVRVSREFEIITALSARVDTALLTRLLSHPNVEYVVPDHELELTDRIRRDGAPFRRAIETIPYGVSLIRAPQAWALTNPASYGEGVKVAILDTGGDFDHQDLVFAGGYDVGSGSADPAAWDDDIVVCKGHGTHVSGTVGARRGNDLGVVGVAPEALLYMVKVAHPGVANGSPTCAINVSDLIGALQWTMANEMQVVSMSLGGPHNPAEQEAIAAAAAGGLVLVAAVGNEADDVRFPAAYAEVIAVAATDGSDNRASDSNFGPEVEVSAPGVSVPSTVPNDAYDFFSGTSMSTPHVAGLVALILAHRPATTPARVRELLRDGAVDRGEPGPDRFFGAGRVDALNTVSLLLAPATAPAQLAITQQPGGAVSGGAFGIQPVVRLRDAGNQPVGQAGVVVTASIASGGGQLSVVPPVEVDGVGRKRALAAQAGGTTAVTNAGGVATFPDLAITGSGIHTLQFSAPGLPAVSSAPFDVAPGTVTALQNGVPVTGLSQGTGVVSYFVLTVPAGQTHLDVTIRGSNAEDADLYVRRGQVPTLNTFDCRPFFAGSNETCTFPSPAAGDWYVMLRAFTAFTNVTLSATTDLGAQRKFSVTRQPGGAVSGATMATQPTVQLRDAANVPIAQGGVAVTVELAGGTGNLIAVNPTVATDGTGLATFDGLTIFGEGDHVLRFTSPEILPVLSERIAVAPPIVTALENGVALAGLSGGTGSGSYFKLSVPAGSGQLDVTTSGGTGDADIVVRRGRLPGLADHDCISVLPSNADSCTLLSPAAGDWHVMLFGSIAYADLSLTATYQGPVSAALTVAGGGAGGGRVTSQPGLAPPIDCTISGGVAPPSGCSGTYPLGTTVILAAAPDTFSAFTGWSGAGCALQNPCALTVDQARTVTAGFGATHVLTVAGQGTGSGVVTSQAGLAPGIGCTIVAGVAQATGCSAAYLAGTSVTLTVAPASGSLFAGWDRQGCPSLPTCTVTVSAALGVTVGFVVAPSAELAADELLGTPRLSPEQRGALDLAGNRNGRLDVGDYLALLDRLGLNPSPETMARILDPRRGAEVSP